jgi:hypothetical protein
MAYMGRSLYMYESSDDKIFRKRVGQLDKKRLAIQVRRCRMRPFDLLYVNLPQRTWQSGEGLDRTPYAVLMEKGFANRVHYVKMAVSIAEWTSVQRS